MPNVHPKRRTHSYRMYWMCWYIHMSPAQPCLASPDQLRAHSDATFLELLYCCWRTMSKQQSLTMTISPGDNNKAVTLNCTVINTKCKVLVKLFQLLVLWKGPCSLIIAYSKMAIPSLRPINFDKFSLQAPSDELPATAPLDLKISGSGRCWTFNTHNHDYGHNKNDQKIIW